jgi:hypothetical protein
MQNVLFWTWAVICGFVHGLALFVIAYLVLHEPWSLWSVSIGVGAILVFGTTAYGHLVFLALLLRRLQRKNANLKIPKRIARVLARILDAASLGI